jgi:hypothetical protein
VFNVGGHQFDMDSGQQLLIRIIPTTYEADLAYCAPDLIQYYQEWTPLGHERWLREREEKKKQSLSQQAEKQ